MKNALLIGALLVFVGCSKSTNGSPDGSVQDSQDAVDQMNDDGFEPLPSTANSPFGWHAAVPYEDAEYIGITWTRGGYSPYVNWSIAQPDWTVGTYQFKSVSTPKGEVKYDQSVYEVPESINILLNLDAGTHTKTDSFEPIDEQGFKVFVMAAVERYDGDDDYGCALAAPDCYQAGDGMYPEEQLIQATKKNPVKYWQVGNEANHQSHTVDDVTSFAEQQRMAYQAVKQADPQAQVLIGGVGAWVDEYTDIYDDSFKPILQALNGQYMDILDFHWYGCAQGDYRIETPRDGLDVVQRIRDSLQDTGFARDLPLWITETGSSTGTLDSDICPPQTEQQQAGDYVKRYVHAVSKGVEKLFGVLGLEEAIWVNPEHYFSRTELIYNGQGRDDLGQGVKKLSFYSFKLMTEKLEGSDWTSMRTSSPADHVYSYEFDRDGIPIWVVWWDLWNEPELESKTVSLDIGDASSAKVTQAVPKFDTGQEVTDYSSAFSTETVSVQSGQVEITLELNPVYVEIEQ